MALLFRLIALCTVLLWAAPGMASAQAAVPCHHGVTALAPVPAAGTSQALSHGDGMGHHHHHQPCGQLDCCSACVSLAQLPLAAALMAPGSTSPVLAMQRYVRRDGQVPEPLRKPPKIAG